MSEQALGTVLQRRGRVMAMQPCPLSVFRQNSRLYLPALNIVLSITQGCFHTCCHTFYFSTISAS